MTAILMGLGALLAIVGLSYLIENHRRAPVPRARASWDPSLRAQYLDVDGVRLRYVETGRGQALVLLHTLRTQLDMFQQIIPSLARQFHVYALDLPGHGYSDIPEASYSADFFVRTIATALDRLKLRDVIVAGESIGGTIGLLLAARHHAAVRAVIAINPYDYARGRGLRRSSLLANAIFGVNNVPVVGATVSRLRSFPIIARVLAGGLHRLPRMPKSLAREMNLVGNRPGHREAFSALVRNWASWDLARAEYRHIDRPTLLVYGDHDWSHPDERRATADAIPGATVHEIENAGHFLSLDAPDELVRAILAWPDARPASARVIAG